MKRWPLIVLSAPVFSATVLSATVALTSCRVDPEPGHHSAPKEQNSLRLGQPLRGIPSTPLARILEHPEEYEGQVVAVEGTVARACTRKGCWMEIADEPGDRARACRVTFENYGFFVPKDSPGSRTRLEGKVVTSRIKLAHVEHLESEGAHFSNKNPDGSALEVQIVATGVEIERDAGSQKQL